jgi:hypothetical protein
MSLDTSILAIVNDARRVYSWADADIHNGVQA